MRGDIPLPAFRLLHSLPVRTHIRPEPVERKSFVPVPVPRGMSTASAIRFRGVTYASMKEAKKRLRVSFRTLQKWIADGSAELV